MNSAKQVNSLVEEWKKKGLSKSEVVVKTAEAELGWPYVWGATGQECTPSKRKALANRGACPEAESAVTIKKCQVLNGSKSSCNGCKYYPECQVVLVDDCQGFVKQIHKRVGITLSGGGATSMWNNNANWTEKGSIADIPMDKVCCVFQWNSKKKNMQHVGEHVGGGNLIHCSGEVKRGKVTDRGWTHYAIPKGMEGVAPMPETRPTIRKGSSGTYVMQAQTRLIELGYDLGASGADGKFGTMTQTAVKDFQARNGLTADGVVGPKTWEALDKGTKPAPAATYTVTIRGLTNEKADEIVGKYGGTKTAE